MASDDGMKAANQLANEIFHRSVFAWGSVFTFREMCRHGRSQAIGAIAQERAANVREVLSSDEYAGLFTVDRKDISPDTIDQWLGTLIQNDAKTYEASLDAASLVFAHSLLDGIAMDLCRVCSLVRPTDFMRWVDQKRFSLADSQHKLWLDLLKMSVSDYLKTVERESIIKKLDLLFSLCQPPKKFEPMAGYRYDRERIQALDDLRHRYVHGAYPAERLTKGDDDLVFLQRTSLFLLGLVNQRYGIHIDSSALQQQP